MTLFLQSVTAPNGLIAHMYGPIVGRRHDTFMLSVSDLQSKLATITKQGGSPYVIYGDPAYGVSLTILAPYCSSQLTPQESNESCVLVEWTFGKIVTNFPTWTLKKATKVCCSQ